MNMGIFFPFLSFTVCFFSMRPCLASARMTFGAVSKNPRWVTTSITQPCAKVVPKGFQVFPYDDSLKALWVFLLLGFVHRISQHANGCKRLHKKKLWGKVEDPRAKKPKIRTRLTVGTTHIPVFFFPPIFFAYDRLTSLKYKLTASCLHKLPLLIGEEQGVHLLDGNGEARCEVTKSESCRQTSLGLGRRRGMGETHKIGDRFDSTFCYKLLFIPFRQECHDGD